MEKSNTRPAPDSPTRFNYGYIVVAAAFVICMMNVGMFLSMGVFFKPISVEMGWTRADTSLPISLSTFVTAIMSIVAGNLIDRLGPRKVALIFVLFTGAGYLLMSRLTSLWQFYLYFGVLIGAGSCLMAPFLSLIPRWFNRGRTVMAGIIAAGGGVGGLILPLVSNWLITAYSWQQAYLYLGIAYLAITLIAVQFLRRSPVQPLIMPQSAPRIKTNPPAEKIPEYSLSRFFMSRNFWLLAIMAITFGFVANTINMHSAPNATDIGISSTAAAGLLSLMNGVSIAGSILLGAMGDKFGNRRMILVTFILEGAAMLWLAHTNQLWGLYIFMAVYGLAFGSGLAQIPALIPKIYGTRSLGLLLGIITFLQTAGASLGSFLPGFIYDNNQSYFWAFIAGGLMCAMAVAATLALKKNSRAQSF